jgi:hypothetical protein
MTGKIAILDHFSALKDPRQSWKVVYPLPEIILLILAATIAGADDFVEIEAWGNERLDFLRTFLPYERGIPSHDALNDLVNALDPELFKACFTSWVASLREDDPDIVAVDGKTSRRTHNRARGREPLHLVSAWAARQRLVLGQQAIDARSNEIKAIPLLLERLALKGAIVTIDAMGTQTEIAETIVEKGADYCLALKENRPLLYQDVERFFADPPPGAVATFKTTDGIRLISTKCSEAPHENLSSDSPAIARAGAWMAGGIGLRMKKSRTRSASWTCDRGGDLAAGGAILHRGERAPHDSITRG